MTARAHGEGSRRDARTKSAMPSLEAKRTLVKSPPEIWAEVSDAGALARHLGEFGEIRITRTQPEEVVEWEGDLASGCVRLEPSGWGTKVTLTAEAPDPSEPDPEAAPALTTPMGSDLAIKHFGLETQDPAPEEPANPHSSVPEADAGLQDLTPVGGGKRSWWARLWRRRAPEAPPVAESVPVQAPAPPPAEAVQAPPPPPPPPVPALDLEKAEATLTGVLDTLGAAHHRPFSRP